MCALFKLRILYDPLAAVLLDDVWEDDIVRTGKEASYPGRKGERNEQATRLPLPPPLPW